MTRRNPIRDQVAIVGVGSTGYGRDLGRSRTALALEACRAAIGDAGLDAADIDGVCGNPTQASPQLVQSGLGLPATTWWSTPPLPFSLMLIDAANAVFSGACTTALVYQSQFRTVGGARSQDVDPVRRVPPAPRAPDPNAMNQFLIPYGGRSVNYAGYMRRYMHEYRIGREPFGLIAINSRTGAAANPAAVAREPLTMEGYLAGRMVRDPMCIYDIDYAVDGADAVVLTTVERARDLVDVPVLLESASYGQGRHPLDDTYGSLDDVGQRIAAETLWSKSELSLADMNLVMLYDGFTVVALTWLESLGYCAPGEAAAFVHDHWNAASARLVLPGGARVNTHGGSLSEGATQGAGHVREAVDQLRGCAGERQLGSVSTALLAIGGLFINSTALVLRR